MGYTGVALKACKGQSHAMLMAAAAQKFGMFLCALCYEDSAAGPGPLAPGPCSDGRDARRP
jgi:hypothetical protein